MLFNSYLYILIFLPATCCLYFFLNKNRLMHASRTLLVAGSLLFYSYWNPSYLILILGSVLFNYTVGTTMSRGKIKGSISLKAVLSFGITINLGVLIFFKYYDFFIDNFNAVTGSNFHQINLLLPLAISFFTFQQIAYLVDSYRNYSG